MTERVQTAIWPSLGASDAHRTVQSWSMLFTALRTEAQENPTTGKRRSALEFDLRKPLINQRERVDCSTEPWN